MRIAGDFLETIANGLQIQFKFWMSCNNFVDSRLSARRDVGNIGFIWTRCCIVGHCWFPFFQQRSPWASEASRLSFSIFKKSDRMSTFGLSPRLSRHFASMRGGGRLWQSLKARAAIRRRSSLPRLSAVLSLRRQEQHQSRCELDEIMWIGMQHSEVLLDCSESRFQLFHVPNRLFCTPLPVACSLTRFLFRHRCYSFL